MIVENHNLIVYLKDKKEIKAVKKIEKVIGKDFKVKDLINNEILLQLNSAKSVGKKTLKLIHKYTTDDNLKNLINSRDELKNVSEFNANEVEQNIIRNVEIFYSELNDREKFIFSTHYGYKTNVLTLEKAADGLYEIEKTKRVTRERIRQIINIIKKKLVYKPYFNLPELIKYLENVQSKSFHKIFPKLDEIFTDTAKTKKIDISGDRLNQFLADLTGKKKDHYKTPELLLKNEFDQNLLNEIFLELPYGISENIFSSEVKTLFGFDNSVTKQAIKFMDNKKLILHKKGKIYPLNLNAVEEVAHICLKFPKGIFWRDIYAILNKSPSKNGFSNDRLVADHKISDNDNLWLCAKGTHKHINYLPHKENKTEIIQSVYNVLKNKNEKALKLIEVYNSIKSNNSLNKINLDYFELRAFIKIFGKEKGIFWKGKSSVDTISLNKNFNYLKNQDNILNIINKSPVAIHEKQIIKLMHKGTDISTIISQHGEKLLREKKVMRVGPKLWYNYNKGLNLCDINLLKKETAKLFDIYDTVSLHYITNYLNTRLNLALSYYYYDSIFESMDTELKLFFYNAYISKKNVKFTTEKIYRNYFKDNLDLNKNVKQIAAIHRILITPEQFLHARYIYI